MAYQNQVVAFGVVTGATAALVNARGIPASAHTGVGDYLLTLAELADVNDCQIDIEPRAAVDVAWAVVHTSDTQKQILTFTANTGAALDCDFAITVRKCAAGLLG